MRYPTCIALRGLRGPTGIPHHAIEPLYMTLTKVITVFAMKVIVCSVSGAIAVRKLQAADPADIF
jgi:hypothetical protein